MAKKKRVRRKQLLNEPDEFLAFSAKAIRFVVDNQRMVICVAIGVVVIALAFGGYRYFSNLSERKACAMFERGRLQYLAEIAGDKTAEYQGKAAEQFEEVIRKYPSTDAAGFSLFCYADASYHMDDFQKAIESYQTALNAFSGNGAIRKLIWNGLAYAHEAQKDYTSAAEYFQEIIDDRGDFMKADAYNNYGRMMEALNQQDKALEAYNMVVQAYPDSVAFQIAKEKVLRLKDASVGTK